MSLFPIALFSNSEKARPLQQRLQAAGIPAQLHGESPLAKMWLVSRRDAGEQVLVPGAQIGPAERLLGEWDQHDKQRHTIRCPECRSLRVLYPQYAQNSLLTNLLIGVAASLRLVERDFYCQDCHYTWPKHGTRARRNRPHMAPYYYIEGVEQTSLEHPVGVAPPPSREQPPEQRRAA